MDNQQLVNSYLSQGFTIETQSDSSVIMVKKKKFSWVLFLILILFLGFGLLYALYYLIFMKDERVQIVNGIVNKL